MWLCCRVLNIGNKLVDYGIYSVECLAVRFRSTLPGGGRDAGVSTHY